MPVVVNHTGELAIAWDTRNRRRRHRGDGSSTFVKGGAILNEDGEMIGSTLYVQFDSRDALDEWLQSDPYVTGGVWVDIDVKPIRLVP